MKCRVCGYETNDSRSYCPMCGTKSDTAEKLRESTAIDMAWNTKDFPKPKKMEDIEMNWGEQPTFMKKDGSEGFYTVKNEAHVQPEKEKPNDFEIPSFMNRPAQQFKPAQQMDRKPETSQQPKAPDYSSIHPKKEENFAAWTMPPRQAEPDYKYYNIPQSQLQPEPFPTYTPSSAFINPSYTKQSYTPSPTPALTPAEKEFWYGKEYQNTVQTIPYQVQPQSPPQPVYQTPVQTIQYQPVYQQPMYQTQPVYQAPVQPMYQPPVQPVYQAPVQPQAHQPVNYEGAYPKYDAVNSQAQKMPEQFYTFQAKTDEFQKLLDEQYERINALYGSDYSIPGHETQRETKCDLGMVKAQNVSDFEKSLFGDEIKAASKEEPAEESKPFVLPDRAKPERPQETLKPDRAYETAKPFDTATPIFFNETDSSELSLEELISDPLDPRFNIDTLERTIKELKQQEVVESEKCSERRKKLAAMEAAREAYFKSLDEEADIKGARDIDPKSRREDDIFSPERKAEEAPQDDVTEIKSEPEDKNSAEKPEEIKEEEKPEEEKSGDTDPNPALKDLYADDDDESEDDEKRSSGFLKVIGVIVIIVALCELAILALKNFLPDSAITTTATQIEVAVIDAFKNAFAKITEFFTNLTNK